jgi:hypothetical protein
VRRRDFIAFVGVAFAWPVRERAQQPGGVRAGTPTTILKPSRIYPRLLRHSKGWEALVQLTRPTGERFGTPWLSGIEGVLSCERREGLGGCDDPSVFWCAPRHSEIAPRSIHFDAVMGDATC